MSDPRDLDANPELGFIDAVDVDGDGRAELLFQRQEGGGRTFKLREGEPLQTSFGKDLYDKIFGEDHYEDT